VICKATIKGRGGGGGRGKNRPKKCGNKKLKYNKTKAVKVEKETREDSKRKDGKYKRERKRNYLYQTNYSSYFPRVCVEHKNRADSLHTGSAPIFDQSHFRT
jgi:hypothetical protein